MEWADMRFLANARFFLITKELFDLENYFLLHVPAYQGKFWGNAHIEKLWFLRDSLHETRRFEYPWALLNIPDGTEKILDAGSGYTAFPFYVSQLLQEYCCLDVDVKAMKSIEKTKQYTGRFDNVKAFIGDMRKMDFMDASFDCVLCISVLEHVCKCKEDMFQAIHELLRVTRQGGMVLITLDVKLSEDRFTPTLQTLNEMAEELNFTVPVIPLTAFCQKMKGDSIPFLVACIKLVKPK